MKRTDLLLIVLIFNNNAYLQLVNGELVRSESYFELWQSNTKGLIDGILNSVSETVSSVLFGQQYEDVFTSDSEEVSDDELVALSELLYKLDDNRPAEYININLHGNDASQPLISIKPYVWNIRTISAMKSLMDNYVQDHRIAEDVTPQERDEEDRFIDLVLNTRVMKQLMWSLQAKGLVSQDPRSQKELLHSIWFDVYSRGCGILGSSGFEHVFLSEIKRNKISGMHNWLYFHLEEQANRASYLGRLNHVDFGNNDGIIKFHFILNGIHKPVTSMLYGCSPELEMALYTLCYMTRSDDDCYLSINGNEFNVRTYNYEFYDADLIGSAYTVI